MYECDKRCDIFDFVGLQVSDEVPVDVGGQECLLSRKFLNTAFSEVTLPGVVCFANVGYGVVFGDGNELYALRQFVDDSFDLGCYHEWL